MEQLLNFIAKISPIQEKTWEKVQKLFIQEKLVNQAYFSRAGHYAKKIAFLETGIVRAFYRNEKGEEYNKHFSTAPAIIGGYSSLITGEVTQINLQVLTDCQLWVATYTDFCQLYDTHTDLERVGED